MIDGSVLQSAQRCFGKEKSRSSENGGKINVIWQDPSCSIVDINFSDSFASCLRSKSSPDGLAFVSVSHPEKKIPELDL